MSLSEQLRNIQKRKKTNAYIELLLWEGDYGTPSVDTDSLVLYTYLRTINVDFTPRHPKNPFLHTIPSVITNMNFNRQLTVEKEGIINFHKVTTHLKFNEMESQDSWITKIKACMDKEFVIPDEEQLYYRIYIEYLKRCLLPGIWYTMWGNDQNYIEVTGKWYKNNLWFPFNMIYPYIKRKIILNHLRTLVPDNDLETYSYMLIDQAKDCLNVLSGKLNGSTYFSFKNHPSILDIFVYSYLAPLMHAPYPSNHLQIHLKEQENIVAFIKKFNNKYFPDLKVEFKYVTKHQDDDHEIKSSPGLIFTALFCATAAMLGYGMIIGAFQTS